MKKLFPILAILLFSALNGRAGDIITATVVISSTSATNLNGTNAASITIGSDTRIATNNVVSASTQFYASTNAANAAFYLLNHLRGNPFTTNTIAGIGSTNLGVVLVGQEGVTFSIVISNSWATVAYRTNTVGTARVVRVPPTIESATTRTNVGNGIVDYLNQAHTTTEIDDAAASAAQLVGVTTTQTVTGQKTLSNTNNLLTAQQLTLDLSALAVDNGGTNFWVDFLGDAYKTITATNNLNFQATTNRVAARTVVLILNPNGTNRSLSFNTSWTNNFIGAIPSVLTNGTIGVLSLTTWGASETNVIPAYAVLGIGGGGTDTDDQTAAEVPNTPAGSIAATDVQAALNELDTEKAPLASPTFTGTVTAGTLAGALDAGGATSFEIPNGAAPTTDATGEIALDTTITDHKSLIQYDGGADEMLVIALPRANLDTTDGDVIKYDAATDAFVMAPDADSGGSTPFNAIGDSAADGDVTIGHTNIWQFTLDGSRFLQILSTDADNAADTTLLTLAFNDGADANSIFLDLISDADGTPESVWKVSATTMTSSLAFTLTGAIDAGGAASFEVPNGNDPDLAVEGQLSYDANGDVLRAYDGANQVAIGRKIEAIHFVVVSPNDLADSERDAFWIWENVSGMSFIVTGWSFKSDTDDTTLNIEEIDNDGANNTTVDAVEIATNGTGLFYASDTTITAPTIENGHLIVIDFDDTDTPGQVRGTIYGYYDANVN
jgi:hypothetical protein